ncbi:MAG: GIY-YIG nuclease family protein, partial [Candidatus Entotheonellia bacterium]
MDLQDKLATMPTQPGVYLMKNRGGTVLYVGKAKNLRSRVRSYFRKSGDGRFRIQFLIPNIEDIEFLVTDTEKEALILENTLIKEHRPKYNVN